MGLNVFFDMTKFKNKSKLTPSAILVAEVGLHFCHIKLDFTEGAEERIFLKKEL